MRFNNTRSGERLARILIGILLLAIGWRAEVGWWSLPLRVFALYPLVTGLAGWCPIYSLLRIGARR